MNYPAPLHKMQSTIAEKFEMDIARVRNVFNEASKEQSDRTHYFYAEAERLSEKRMPILQWSPLLLVTGIAIKSSNGTSIGTIITLASVVFAAAMAAKEMSENKKRSFTALKNHAFDYVAKIEAQNYANVATYDLSQMDTPSQWADVDFEDPSAAP